jgi:signal transduction histidine kinase
MPTVPAATVLVIDDNAENRALASATLEDEGYRAVLAGGGEEGLRAFESERPDCVLLDVRMPGLDGFAVCSRIRALPGGAEVPIVFLTALRDLDTFDRVQASGGDDFLTKPYRPSELAMRVQAALKLRRVSSELRETYDQMRRQRDDLMRLQLQKERLTSFVVHDLKNPVNSMDLHAQVLLREEGLSERARRSADSIRAEARALLRLVLNLLDISKSEEGRLLVRPSVVALPALFEDLVDALRAEAESAGVRLVQTASVRQVFADPELLRRVLENLLDNAIRHAPKGSAVRLEAIPRDGGVELRVADQGSGIAPELRDRVFDRFMQVDASDRPVSRAGRGLGLAFCKLAVEAHGGSVSIEDGTPGAVFCVRLPDGP